MKLGTTKLIPENIAPENAKNLAIFDGETKICDVSISKIQPNLGTPLYSFCALSDIHLNQETANEDFQRALTYVENSDCAFTCISGDLTINGSITEWTMNEMQFYKDMVDTYAPTKPVYAVSGNHETSYGVYITDERIQPYTGHGLYYSFERGNDVFIMLGYYGAYQDGNGGWRSDEFVSVEELQWLYETLEANRNKRCFIFIHVLPHEHGVGNPCGLYTTALIWKTTDGGIGQALMSLLRHYKNITLFHGHSHMRFLLQEIDKKANYSSEDGYRSVHISSLASPRGTVDETTGDVTSGTIFAESEGYIVDVYDNCILLKGRDFIDNDADGHIIPIAQYKIDTTLVEIEAGTFVDDTGIIQVA